MHCSDLEVLYENKKRIVSLHFLGNCVMFPKPVIGDEIVLTVKVQFSGSTSFRISALDHPEPVFNKSLNAFHLHCVFRTVFKLSATLVMHLSAKAARN